MKSSNDDLKKSGNDKRKTMKNYTGPKIQKKKETNVFEITTSGISFASGGALLGSSLGGPLGGVIGAITGAFTGLCLSKRLSKKIHDN